MFRAHVRIIRRSKLHYTASGIITPTGALHSLWYYHNYRCDVVGPCHHGMARPQVADRGTASFMEGSCE